MITNVYYLRIYIGIFLVTLFYLLFCLKCPYQLDELSQTSSIRNNSDWLIKMKQLIRYLNSSTLFGNGEFSNHRFESLRYYGNQQKLYKCLRRIFTMTNPHLNILITGGSTSVPRKINTNESYHAVFCQALREISDMSGLNMTITCDNIAIGASGRFAIHFN